MHEGYGQIKKTLETSMFAEIYRDLCARRHFDSSELPLISDEVLKTCHPGLLYQLALICKPEASNEELFEIMKDIKSMETSLEGLKLATVEQAQDLLTRYKEKSKSFVISKK